MATKNVAMHALSPKERNMLLVIIDETYGTGLSRDEFAEAMLSVFENISGFEAISPDKANHIVNQLWSIHHGKKANRNDQSKQHYPEPIEPDRSVLEQTRSGRD